MALCLIHHYSPHSFSAVAAAAQLKPVRIVHIIKSHLSPSDHLYAPRSLEVLILASRLAAEFGASLWRVTRAGPRCQIYIFCIHVIMMLKSRWNWTRFFKTIIPCLRFVWSGSFEKQRVAFRYIQYTTQRCPVCWLFEKGMILNCCRNHGLISPRSIIGTGSVQQGRIYYE